VAKSLNTCIIKFIYSELIPGARILAKDPDAPPARLVEIPRDVCAHATYSLQSERPSVHSTGGCKKRMCLQQCRLSF